MSAALDLTPMRRPARVESNCITTSNVFNVRSQRALQEALKGQLGKDSYAAIEQKFA